MRFDKVVMCEFLSYAMQWPTWGPWRDVGGRQCPVCYWSMRVKLITQTYGHPFRSRYSCSACGTSWDVSVDIDENSVRLLGVDHAVR